MLPDILEPGLRVVFCGTAVGERSATRGDLYTGVGNEFWRYLYKAGLTTRQLRAAEAEALPSFGIGLSAVATGMAQNRDRRLASFYGIEAFASKITRYRPEWVAFHGKEAARAVSGALRGERELCYGAQDWLVADAHVFVVPHASGADGEVLDREAQRGRLDRKGSRFEWFDELAATISPRRSCHPSTLVSAADALPRADQLAAPMRRRFS